MHEILFVDDRADGRATVLGALQHVFPHARCHRVLGTRQALALLDLAPFELAIVPLTELATQGLDLIERLARRWPHCTVLVASEREDEEQVFLALQAGAQGQLLTGQTVAGLVRQLLALAHGQPPLSPALVRRLLGHCRRRPDGAPPLPLAHLSARECQVLRLLAHGERVPAIGAALGISHHTASDHVKHIYRKLSIRSRAEAALQARGLGLV